jgi:hypothetical protein
MTSIPSLEGLCRAAARVLKLANIQRKNKSNIDIIMGVSYTCAINRQGPRNGVFAETISKSFKNRETAARDTPQYHPAF